MQKARRHPTKGLRPLVSVWFQDLFHSVIHGSFHLSLTVLFHYRSPSSIQPYGVVPTSSYEIPRASHYSGSYHALSSFIYRTFTFYGMLFQNISTRFLSHLCSPSPQVNYFSWFRLFLFRSPLLQESSFLSFPAGTKMFQFPAFPSHTLLYLRMDNQIISSS